MKLTLPALFPAARSLGGGIWKLAEPWTFEIEGVSTTVPPGFETDLYSAPWWITWAIPRDEADNRPSMVHDWLYGTVGLRATASSAPRFDRAACDEALREACRICGFSAIRRNAIHLGVRLGGSGAWSRVDRGGYSAARPCLGRAG